MSIIRLLLFCQFCSCLTTAFVPIQQSTSRKLPQLSAAATLTDTTTWSVRLLLQNVPTTNGKTASPTLTFKVQFVEDEGYEPPQGQLKQIDSGSESSKVNIVKSFWKLSEDPNDRKDGLWVWGLFAEPLYPYLLLQLDIDSIQLDSSDDSKADSIQPLQLYAQINHRRDKQRGVLLEAGSDLFVRQLETLNADPFGVAKVDYYENVKIGTFSVLPMV